MRGKTGRRPRLHPAELMMRLDSTHLGELFGNGYLDIAYCRVLSLFSWDVELAGKPTSDGDGLSRRRHCDGDHRCDSVEGELNRLLNRQFKHAHTFHSHSLVRRFERPGQSMLSLISRSAKYSVHGFGRSLPTCLASKFHEPHLISN